MPSGQWSLSLCLGLWLTWRECEALLSSSSSSLSRPLSRPRRLGHLQLHSGGEGSLLVAIGGYRPWWEDDLPNLFGINPIEAAVLFGVLYYFYGSETLYEYAREAGRLFSTYAPIVKDISLDIFKEFREYFEEDRDRAALRRAGVDLDKIPRKTTNIIEKFQTTFTELSGVGGSEVDGGKGKGSDMTTAADLQSVYSAAVPDQEKELAEGRRRSKRQVLEARNVDVDQVIEATDAITRGDDLNAAGLSESFSAVRDSFDALKERAEGTASGGGGGEAGEAGQEMGLGSMARPEGAGSTTISKFQMQMSGEWNNRVLADSPDDATFGPGDNFYDDEEVYEEDDFTNSFLQKWERVSTTTTTTSPVVENVPQELSMAPLPLDLRSNSAAALMLQELDKDYLSLRQRLVDILQTVESQPQPPPSLEAATPSLESSPSSSQNAQKYWPPLARLKRDKV